MTVVCVVRIWIKARIAAMSFRRLTVNWEDNSRGRSGFCRQPRRDPRRRWTT